MNHLIKELTGGPAGGGWGVVGGLGLVGGWLWRLAMGEAVWADVGWQVRSGGIYEKQNGKGCDAVSKSK